MRSRHLPVLTALLMAGSAAMAAESTERSTPYDKNPACMDRTTDASSGNCVVQDEGTPRQTYPPKQTTKGGKPTQLPAATATSPSTVRTAPAAGK